MSILLQLAIALAIFVAGAAGGVKWQLGVDARQELQARELRDSDARQQRGANDKAAGRHAATLATLNTQLGDARARIATLTTGSACLGPDAVSVLNATGLVDGGAAAGQPARTPDAVAPGASHGTGLRRVTTDTDVAGYIAACRTKYAEVSSQLNQILDIEDRRHPPDSSTTER